jgi:hypothetical protein
LKATTEKLLKNKDKYQECRKHKVLIIGDSYVRGCATEMIASLDARIDVYGVVIPEFDTGLLSENEEGSEQSPTHNFLVISSGPNYIVRNDSRTAFRNIANFIKNVNNTNITLISAHYRYCILASCYIRLTLNICSFVLTDKRTNIQPIIDIAL